MKVIASVVLGIGLSLGLGQAFAQTSVLEDSEEFLIVRGEQAPCAGVAPMMCLQIKRSFDQSGWELFYSPIQGFELTQGESSLLRVKVTEVEDPPADSSSLRYELVDVVAVMPSIIEK